MARTYTYDPYNVPNVFKALVSKVSANLSSDEDLPSIPYVKYKFGTWLEILDQLIADSKSPETKNSRYPLVCLIQRFPEVYEYLNVDSIKVDIVIVNLAGKTDKLSHRYDNNFANVLYPIYAELKQVIADSHYFMGSNVAFSHTKYDIPHMGIESSEGEQGYRLPDAMDGILMKDVALKLNIDSCSRCTLDYQLDYVDSFELEVTLEVGNILQILASNENTATYKLYLDGTEQLGYLIGNPYGISLTGLADGQHILKVTSSTGSQVEAEFTTLNDALVSNVSDYEFAYDLDIPCGISPIATASIAGTITAENMIFESHQVYIDETQVFTEELAEDSLPYEYDLSLIDTSSHKIRHFIKTANGNTLTQIFYIKLKTT